MWKSRLFRSGGTGKWNAIVRNWILFVTKFVLRLFRFQWVIVELRLNCGPATPHPFVSTNRTFCCVPKSNIKWCAATHCWRYWTISSSAIGLDSNWSLSRRWLGWLCWPNTTTRPIAFRKLISPKRQWIRSKDGMVNRHDTAIIIARWVLSDVWMACVSFSYIFFSFFFLQRYQLHITNDRQPLLICTPRDKDLRGGRDKLIALIPEFCLATGYTDEMRSNFQWVEHNKNNIFHLK